jgi:run domain Beclin-1 interacting cysteine-rich containing protein
LINDHDQDRSVFGDSSTTDGPDEQEIDDDSFEVLSFEAPPESTLYIKGIFLLTHVFSHSDQIFFPEFQYTTSNSQNNVCSCCNTAFTANVPARRCHYYGKLYCPRCHNMDQAYIPAKIIKSFNMNLYPVCRRAKSILQLNFYQPIFDIQNDNENLYALVPILSEIKSFRLQFQHFYAYLSTCTRIDNELHEKFFHEFYARDYLYQSVHLYSINDFLSLKKILHTLRRASTRAKEHIYQCLICREKGFTCEICKNRNHILYPFEEMKTIGQCDHCSNIYHKQCWDNIDHDCPKCYRLIQRKQEQNKI